MIGVERWAELRREHFVGGKSIKALARETGLSRNTIRAALRATEPPGYRRTPAGSRLDPFKGKICELLGGEPTMPGVRVRELLEPYGCTVSKTVVDDYLREIRPLFLPRRTFQRTVYRPGEICQFDLWEPRAEIAVGHGQTRKGYVVIACLGYSRAGAGTLIFSKQIPDLLAGIRRCLWQLGGLAETLVWDRQSGLHAGGGRPTEDYAGFCGALKVGWHFCQPRDPQAKGVVEAFPRLYEPPLVDWAPNPAHLSRDAYLTLGAEAAEEAADHNGAERVDVTFPDADPLAPTRIRVAVRDRIAVRAGGSVNPRVAAEAEAVLWAVTAASVAHDC